MPISGREALTYFSESGYRVLAITPEHAASIETLPSLHTDPFDRMLVAQALYEPLRLVTHDTQVAQYNDTIMLV
jgi:PIN domain nuclease of toxin-antitoxin system